MKPTDTSPATELPPSSGQESALTHRIDDGVSASATKPLEAREVAGDGAETVPPCGIEVDGGLGAIRASSPDDEATLGPGVPVRPVTAEPAKKLFGEYELIREIARGGMGVVYEARHTKLNRIVALKMILAGQFAGPQDVQRFFAEAEAAAQLDHIGIVPIFDIGECDGQHFFAMAYIDGESLADRLRGGPMPVLESATILRQVSQAVAYAHSQDIIHRDLKPANILLSVGKASSLSGTTRRQPNDATPLPAAGNGDSTIFSTKAGHGGPAPRRAPSDSIIPKIADFGLAKKLHGDSNLTGTGQVMGTPSYMPPEQASGKKEVGPPADIYSLGAILYCQLTGRPPFQAATAMDTLLAVMEQEPVPPSRLNAKIPRDLETICLKCLEKLPERRYESASILAEELDRFIAGVPIVARPVGYVERGWRWIKRNPRRAAQIAVLAALLTWFQVRTVLSEREARRSQKEEVVQREQAEKARSEESLARRAAEDAQASEAGERRRVEQLAGENRRQLVRFSNANGGRLLEAGDAGGAFAWYAEGVRLSAGDKDAEVVGRARLEAIWQSCPKPKYLWKHADRVHQLAVNRDDTLVATCSGDATARIWNLENGLPQTPPLKHNGEIYSLAFSPDGKRLVTAGGAVGTSGEIRIWSVADGSQIGPTLKRADTFTYVGFGTDSTRLMSCDFTLQARTFVRVWQWDDKTGGKQLGVREVNGGPFRDLFEDIVSFSTGRALDTRTEKIEVIDVAASKPVGPAVMQANVYQAKLSTDGKRFALAARDGNLRVYEAETGKPLSPALDHYFAARRIGLEKPSELLVAYWDGNLQAYELPTGKALRGPQTVIGFRGWTPIFAAGDRIVSIAPEGGVRVWNSSNREPYCPPLNHSSTVNDVHFVAGRYAVAACGDGTVRVWDLALRLRPEWSAANQLRPLQSRFRPDGNIVVLGNSAADFYDVQKQSYQMTFSFGGPWASSAIDRLATRIAVGDEKGAASVFDAITGKIVGGPFQHTKRIIGEVILSDDGKLLATRAVTGNNEVEKLTTAEVHLWNLETGKRVNAAALRISGGFASIGAIGGVAFSPNGRLLAMGGASTGLGGLAIHCAVYDTATCQAKWPNLPCGKTHLPSQFAFSRVGLLMAGVCHPMSSAGSEIRIWNLATGAAVGQLLLFQARVNQAEFDPTGTKLATAAGNQLQVWDVATGKPALPIANHPETVTVLKYSPNGRYLVTAAGSKLFVWDAATLEAVTPPLPHPSFVNQVLFSDDGVTLYSATFGSFQAWKLQPRPRPAEQLNQMARLLAGRQIEAAGTVSVAAAKSLEDWKNLSAADPSSFEATVAQQVSFTVQLRNEASNRGDLPAAIAAQSRLIKILPNEWVNWAWRGHLHACQKSYRAGADDLLKAAELEPNICFTWYRAGCCLIAAEDWQRLRKVNEAMLQRFSNTKDLDFGVAEQTAKLCLLPAKPLADLAVASKLADYAVTADPNRNDYGWLCSVKGYADYRNGKYPSAKSWLEKVRAKPPSPLCGILAESFLAMTEQKLGRHTEARQLLNLAKGKLTNEKQPGTGEQWIDYVLCRYVLIEVEQVVAMGSSPAVNL